MSGYREAPQSSTLRRRATGLAPLLLLPLLAGCFDSPTFPEVVDPPIGSVVFASSLGIELADFTEDSSGIWIREDEPGEGTEVVPGSDVRLYYSGWVSGGEQFDRAEPEDGPANELLVGAAGPIEGLTEGLIGMRPGGLRTVLVPPSLGFGGLSFPGVPPNSWLVLRIQVVTVDGDSGPGGDLGDEGGP